uniref:Uncharacterized protein n=1 Tax=Hyaloperonospora arabidopsidis (strain Emoy2) TaxID=559515 RepID=M4BWD9_HYAAE
MDSRRKQSMDGWMGVKLSKKCGYDLRGNVTRRWRLLGQHLMQIRECGDDTSGATTKLPSTEEA